MTNLEKVWEVWKNLDLAFVGRKQSKREFLCTLVANGNRDSASAMLAKIAGDVKSAEDNKMYVTIQLAVMALLNHYNDLPDVIESLNDYIESLVNATPQTGVSFDELMNIIQIGQNYVVPCVEFDVSPVGMELITAENVHRVRQSSLSAIMIPSWMKSIPEDWLGNSEFHTAAAKEIQENSEKRKPYLILSHSANLQGKTMIGDNERYLVCGDTQVEVVML